MKVKTYSGEMIERSHCRKIQNTFYKIGDTKVKDSGECYKVDGKYHRFNNGLIEYDYEKKEYVLTNKVPLRRGVVGFEKDGTPILGFFTSNITKNVNVSLSSRLNNLAINQEILGDNYKEHYNSGTFYESNVMSDAKFKSIKRPPINKNDLIYDSRFASDMTKRAYDTFYKPSGGNKMIDELGKFLEKNGITYGVEFETSSGYIPERLCYKHGLIPLRDGSIQGLEYVTIPLSGAKGLYNLMDICELLKDRTKYDFKCSMHIHLGGLKRDPNNILAMNNISCLVENDIYAMQPHYKKDSIAYGKSKNYSAPINKDVFNQNLKSTRTGVKSLFNSLFNYLSMGHDFSMYDNDLDNVTKHPNDPSGNRKWNIAPRYAWFNIIPIIFTNKQTVEFRQHNNTFDFFKIFHFIASSAAMVAAANQYTEKFTDSSFLNSISNKSNILETIIKMVAKDNEEFTDGILNSNLKYNSERKSLMENLNKVDPEGVTEHKFYSKFTNDIN